MLPGNGIDQNHCQQARDEGQQAQNKIRLAKESDRKFLNKQETDGRALVVIQWLSQTPKSAIRKIACQAGFISRERQILRILPEAQKESEGNA